MADPTAALGAAFPWGSAIQAGIGGIQAGIGYFQARNAEKRLEKMVAGYKPNSSIMDYYSKALQRYSTNPYTSSLYNQQTKNINRNVNAGIGALQNRRMGLAGISSLVQGQNDAFGKAAAGAEQQQGQALSQLGQASQVKAQEDFKPFEMKFNLLAQKASGGNKLLGAGMQNVFGGLSGIQDMQLANKMYGGGIGSMDMGLGGSPMNGLGSFGGGSNFTNSGGGFGAIKNKSFLNKYGGFRDLY